MTDSPATPSTSRPTASSRSRVIDGLDDGVLAWRDFDDAAARRYEIAADLIGLLTTPADPHF